MTKDEVAEVYMVTVRCDGDRGREMVVANSPGQAKVRSTYYGDVDYTELRAIRASQWYKWMYTRLPPRLSIEELDFVFLEHCSHCGREVRVSRSYIDTNSGPLRVIYDEEGEFIDIMCFTCVISKEASTDEC